MPKIRLKSNLPLRKVTNGALGAIAVAVLLSSVNDCEIPPELAAALAGLTSLITSYITPIGADEVSLGQDPVPPREDR